MREIKFKQTRRFARPRPSQPQYIMQKERVYIVPDELPLHHAETAVKLDWAEWGEEIEEPESELVDDLVLEEEVLVPDETPDQAELELDENQSRLEDGTLVETLSDGTLVEVQSDAAEDEDGLADFVNPDDPFGDFPED